MQRGVVREGGESIGERWGRGVVREQGELTGGREMWWNVGRKVFNEKRVGMGSKDGLG